MSISDCGVTVQNGSEYFLVVEVKEKQDSDPILFELKGAIHQQRVEVFSQGGDGPWNMISRKPVNPDPRPGPTNRRLNHRPLTSWILLSTVRTLRWRLCRTKGQQGHPFCVHYHPGKENVVVDALSRLYMGSVAHVEEERKELAKDVRRLDRLGVRLMSISNGGVTVQNRSESFLVVEVKEKQDSEPILLELKGAIHQQRVEVQILCIQITLRSVPDLQFSIISGTLGVLYTMLHLGYTLDRDRIVSTNPFERIVVPDTDQ
ncbi:hypothetical protein MTR67_039057 [Solanum verrucosum]|uniref:Uncharacterized protein n=1 Tax=Solanum verrucosum TaxID=315347 RepID=A0AAF0UGQ1_SOLVR|nr:hypothetical protein MTR67_039057 [Solanum verrucosum]